MLILHLKVFLVYWLLKSNIVLTINEQTLMLKLTVILTEPVLVGLNVPVARR
jgi:hypothetical protein